MEDIIMYHQTPSISHTLDNRIVDHSDVVEASPVGAAPTTSSFWTVYNGLHRDNCKTRWESFKFWDSVCCLYYEILWHIWKLLPVDCLTPPGVISGDWSRQSRTLSENALITFYCQVISHIYCNTTTKQFISLVGIFLVWKQWMII